MTNKILITGGTSGIGKGIALYFYNKGWQVLITGRDLAKLEAAKNEMPNAATISYDNLQDGQHESIARFIREEWDGRLDILVNNAGQVELEDMADLTQKSMETMYKTHVISPSLLASACLPFLTATKGQILNISSSHGIKAFAQTTAYGSAKAALNMVTKIWALELAPLGIRVNAIAPGPTQTGILKSAGFTEETIKLIHESEIAGIPLNRRGSVDDIASQASHLLDSGSGWITGVILPVDGGISIS